SGLLPIGLNDRVVVTEDQIEPVRIMRDASDAARRDNPPQNFGQILLTGDSRLSGRSLPAFGEFLADAVLAAVDRDIRLLQTGNRLDLDRVFRSANANTSERVLFFKRKDGADRDKTVRRLRLQWRSRDELQIENVVERLARECRHGCRVAPPLGAC